MNRMRLLSFVIVLTLLFQFQSTALALNQRNRVRAVLQEVSKDILKVVEMCLMPLPNAG